MKGRNVPVSDSTEVLRIFDAALRHIHAVILQDMRPPWLASIMATQAVQGSSLSMYTRPSFLEWTADVAAKVFGSELLQKFDQLAKSCSLHLAGLVARPLYCCTAQVAGSLSVCMQVASMSPLVEVPGERSHWRCAGCSVRTSPSSASDMSDTPRRILRLYPLVLTAARRSTPMRSGHMLAVVFPPPSSFAWSSTEQATTSKASTAEPRYDFNQNTHWFHYNAADSDDIWLASRPSMASPR